MEDSMRIAFRKTETAVMEDKNTFGMYKDKRISAEEGAKRMSKTNGIPVTKEQFVANAKWLGYARRGVINAQ